MIDSLSRTVLQMMARFGGPAELVAEGESAYDPETSTVVVTETRFPLRVMVFDYLPKTSGMGTDATLIQAGDKQVFVQPDEKVPAPVARLNSIIHQGRKYNVIVVKETNPTGTKPLLYELFVRA